MPNKDCDMELFHFIDPCNKSKICKDRELRSALCLMNDEEREKIAHTKRKECEELANGAILRDQKPLDGNRIEFCDNTTFPEYVYYLNEHVFFWTNTGRSNECMEAFGEKYKTHIKLRCQLSDLKEKNPCAEILYSRYNSGATPRTPSEHPRSSSMFQPLASKKGETLVEIVVKGKVKLPDNTEYQCKDKSWKKLFCNTESQCPDITKLDRFPSLSPINGVRLAAMNAEIKYKDRNDLMLAVFAENTVAVGVLTQSTTASAPIGWCRCQLPNQNARALIVNAGNANAFTGKAGKKHVLETCLAVAAEIGCNPEQVLVASTGVIGEPLPVQKIVTNVPYLALNLNDKNWATAAAAMLTTDTFAKGATAETVIDGVPIRINGFAKGSGMIEPNMATMLAFVFTDAAIPHQVLHALLVEANDTTFNAITVDSDTSTSDTCILFATATAGNPIPSSADSPALDGFKLALREVMKDLALQVVRDGEGAKKLIEVEVCGAENHHAAKIIAKSIANSPLVKTAIAGEDANWGRVVMAVGKSKQEVNLERLDLFIGDTQVTKNGQRIADLDETVLDKHLKQKEILLKVDIGVADGAAKVWTCDLTSDYIEINASYRS